jgi:uncharacterized protein
MAKGGFRVFDSDMHIMEPPDLWQRYIDPEFKDIAPRGRTSANVRDLGIIFPGDPQDYGLQTSGTPHKGQNFSRNQEIYREHSQRGWGPDCQLEAMDVEGLDAAVLFPTRGLTILTHPNRDPRFAAAIARGYNDWLHEFCSADPERLLGAGMLSVYDVQDAVVEAKRVAELGFRAVFLRSNIVNGHNWHDPYYEPLWDTLEQLDLPIGFHEASGSSSHQSAEHFEPNFGLRRVYAQPFEQMLGLGSFLGGGVLARHPNLRIAFLEANCSWVPWLIWRLDEGFEREGDIFMQDLAEPPSFYFRRQCLVSVEPDEAPARYTIEEFGPDLLVFSTDYPHGDSKYPEAVDNFLKLPLPDEAKRKILWDNCARFYKVAVPVA